jgi:hypothetical protein
MTGASLYDDVILLWSEEQAALIRRLGASRRDLPNELDLENVAEEIESVGRSELAAVESQLQNILVHLIKLSSEPESSAVRHWRAEVAGFHAELLRRYAPSMRQRLDLDQIWRIARKLVLLSLPEDGELTSPLPERSPVSLDSLLVEDVDPAALAHALRHQLIAKDAGKPR